MAYLAEQRNKFKVPARGCVEIRIDPEAGHTLLGHGVYLQCVPCGDELADIPERSLFECSSCGYTMTNHEAKDLASEYVEAISLVFGIEPKNKRKGMFRWLFKILLGSKRRRRALTS